MENFDKLIIGFILFIITSVLTYLFKMRQIYAVSPKLFRVTPVSKDGSLCEVIIFNKGNQTEEEVRIDIDPELNLELLASNSSDLILDKSTLSIGRLHKGEEASALLLVENGILDHTKLIKLTSKNATGKIVKKLEEVPPNYAKLFLGFILFLSIIPTMIYGVKGYEAYQKYKVAIELKQIYDLGWTGLSRYYHSDLSKSYSKQEFPIHFSGIDKKESELLFEAYNKTAMPLKITIDGKFRKKDDYRYFKSFSIPPMSKEKFSMSVPGTLYEKSNFEYSFHFTFGDEYIYDVVYVYSPQ
ncbi:hypothetical protein KJ870_10930 [bacterium]|nr:hypothetical protein [bacterium]MBU1435443.1 hypothetical protein [bacterium]MBU1502633.1 hypothetical protein [bacterium]